MTDSLRTTTVTCNSVHGFARVSDESLRASVRDRTSNVPAEATITDFGCYPRVRMWMIRRQRAITSGQGAVFYDGVNES